ncbi:MAG: hypothetical protein ACRDLB_04615 [Actinomycetota bacterium]
MRIGRCAAAALASCLSVGLLVSPGLTYPRPGVTEIITVRSDGRQPSEPPVADSWLLSSSMTPDGRYVAFETNLALVAEDVNALSDIYVRDTKAGRTELVSRNSEGVVAVGQPDIALRDTPSGSHNSLSLSQDPTISGDGRFVAFRSSAVNLVPGDVNLSSDVFVHDRKTNRTEMISLNAQGRPPMPTDEEPVVLVRPSSWAPSISDNGRFVSFSSHAWSLVPDDTNQVADVFVRDRKEGITERVSVRPDGDQSSGSCHLENCYLWMPTSSISGDGTAVAFDSISDDLVPGDSNASFDVFVRDLKKGETERVSVASDGAQALDPEGAAELFPQYAGSSLTGNASGADAQRALSFDGRYVAFVSRADNLIPSDSNRPVRTLPTPQMGRDVYVHDRQTHRTERVSVGSTGKESPFLSTTDFQIVPSISSTGRYVSFIGTDVFQVGLSGRTELMLYDRKTGAIDLISRRENGDAAGTGSSGVGDVASTGRYVSFASEDELVSRETNPGQDVFVHDRGPEAGRGGSDDAAGASAGDDAPLVCINDICIPDPLILGSADEAGDVSGIVERIGGDLVGATVAYRPEPDDLFVRLKVSKLPSVAGVLTPESAALVYGLGFRFGGESFEARAQLVPDASLPDGPMASFRLLRDDGLSSSEVAVLQGGYGTTGEEIVFAIPLELLGSGGGGHLTHLSAFSTTAAGAEAGFLDDVVL